MPVKKTTPSIFLKMWPWVCLSCAFYLLFAYGFSFRCSWLVGDEGFYTLAARNVMEGMRPYRDFLVSQMPLMPYVYAAWFYVVGISLESARALSACFGLCSVVLIGFAAFRRAGLTAGVTALFVASLSLNFVGETLITRTQPLTVFLTSCALFVLAKRNPGNALLQAGLAMGFMTLAFLSRLSILPCMLLLWVYLGWNNRAQLVPFGAMVLANVAVLAGCYAFFNADGNMKFGIITSHAEYAQFMPWTWVRCSSTIHDWLNQELSLVVLFVAAFWFFAAALLKRETGFRVAVEARLYSVFLLLSYWGMTGIHWIAPQSYATHQSSIYAFLIIFSAVELAPLFQKFHEEHKGAPVLFAALLLVCQLQASGLELGLGSNGNRGFTALHQAVDAIRKNAGPGDSILSFSPELAVESGLRVPSGYEWSEFCYFPRMTDERCAKLKTVNLQKLVRDIDSAKYRLFCVDDRLFNIMACGSQDFGKQLKERIDRNYEQAATIPHYGQFDLNCYIFVLKKGAN